VTDRASTTAVDRISRLCDLGRWQEAAHEAARYLATEPGDVHVLCLLAQARLGLGDPHGALVAARAAMAAAPSHEWPLRLASLALQELDRPMQAVEMARAAVEAAPLVGETHIRLAGAEVAQGGDLESARCAADRALELLPHSVDAHLAAADVAFAQDRFDDAEAACLGALRIDPQSSTAHNELARVRLRSGRFVGSSRLATVADGFATALRVDPTAQVSRRNLDLVMHVFLRRLSFFVLVVAYIGFRLATSSTWESSTGEAPRWALWVPAAALVLPAVFAARFVGKLTPPLRAHLVLSLRSPRHLLPVAGLALACALLVLGAVATPAAPVGFGLSVVLAVGGLIALQVHGRKAGYIES